MTEEDLIKQAEEAQKTMRTLMIIQLFLQIFLKGSLKLLWGLFFTLQMICYITYYVLKIPGNAEIYVEQFTKLIEFDILNPESIVKIFDPSFNLQEWVAGTKATVLNKDHEQSIFKDLTLYIFAIVFAVLTLILLCVAAFVFKKHKKKIV
jgi:hypothetical protein